jgi:hypothetical protein
MKKYIWEPGNATRYELLMGAVDSKMLLCWLREGGAGGTCLRWNGDNTVAVTYLIEKMGVNLGDAVGILSFLESKGFNVVYNTNEEWFPYLEKLRNKKNTLGSI